MSAAAGAAIWKPRMPSPFSPSSRPAVHPEPARRVAWSVLAAAVGLLLLSACQAQPAQAKQAAPAAPPARPAAEPADAMAALRARISAEIGAARCAREDECRTLAVGERPCGGPEAWLAYSTSTGNAAKLAAWAAEWRTLRQAQNKQNQLMSTCQVIADPGAQCVQQSCTLQTAPALR